MGEAAIRAKNLEPFDGDAHAYMISVYKDDTLPVEVRLQAAQGAAHYEKPRLSSIDAKVDQRTTHLSGDDPGDALADAITRRVAAARRLAARSGNGSNPGGDSGPHSGTTH
jgi:hypothetical protein